jgi:hypothetical protein
VNPEHAHILMDSLERGGVGRWNRWRRRAPRVKPNLSGIKLAGRDLDRIDFHGAILDEADMPRASLWRADLRGARLKRANLFMANLFGVKAMGADFRGAWLVRALLEKSDCTRGDFGSWTEMRSADLSSAIFVKAKMREAQLSDADLTATRFDGAQLHKADLSGAVLHGTFLRGAKLNGASLEGAFIRRVRTDRRTEQRSLEVGFNLWSARRGVLSFEVPTVNDIQVAQFYNVLSEHGSVAKLIAAGSMSVVLILGRFTPGRKRVLDRLAWALRARGKSAVVFDFPGPENRELSDTVRFVAALSEFIVVDLTDPSSVPLEMQSFIPDLMVPVVTVIESGARPFAMLADLQRRYYWVLPPVSYRSADHLVRHVDGAIIGRATKAAGEISRRRRLAVRPVRPVGT